ncbi:MAG: head-tail connector protein [Oscillospiraceae bacterium]|jgi:hypothetical protein|nr:head-tail connector protein [Oscillospiraceae bacterium]
MAATDYLLPRVKANLLLNHDADDGFLAGLVSAAVGYAELYQHHAEGHYNENPIPATTEQAVVMLASHWYEARDGSTGGFYGDNVPAAQQVWNAVNNLLRLSRNWSM